MNKRKFCGADEQKSKRPRGEESLEEWLHGHMWAQGVEGLIADYAAIEILSDTDDWFSHDATFEIARHGSKPYEWIVRKLRSYERFLNAHKLVQAVAKAFPPNVDDWITAAQKVFGLPDVAVACVFFRKWYHGIDDMREAHWLRARFPELTLDQVFAQDAKIHLTFHFRNYHNLKWLLEDWKMDLDRHLILRNPTIPHRRWRAGPELAELEPQTAYHVHLSELATRVSHKRWYLLIAKHLTRPNQLVTRARLERNDGDHWSWIARFPEYFLPYIQNRESRDVAEVVAQIPEEHVKPYPNALLPADLWRRRGFRPSDAIKFKLCRMFPAQIKTMWKADVEGFDEQHAEYFGVLMNLESLDEFIGDRTELLPSNIMQIGFDDEEDQANAPLLAHLQQMIVSCFERKWDLGLCDNWEWGHPQLIRTVVQNVPLSDPFVTACLQSPEWWGSTAGRDFVPSFSMLRDRGIWPSHEIPCAILERLKTSPDDIFLAAELKSFIQQSWPLCKF